MDIHRVVIYINIQLCVPYHVVNILGNVKKIFIIRIISTKVPYNHQVNIIIYNPSIHKYKDNLILMNNKMVEFLTYNGIVKLVYHKIILDDLQF